jgi:hypothetical protein
MEKSSKKIPAPNNFFKGEKSVGLNRLRDTKQILEYKINLS